MATSKNVIAAAAVVLRSEGAMEVVREINRVNKELNEMKRDANRAASAMKTLGRAGKGVARWGGGVARSAAGNMVAMGTGAAMGAIRSGGMSALGLMIKEASEAEATMTRLDMVFRKNAASAKAWAVAVAGGLERTEHGVANTETTFMGLFKGLKFGDKVSMKMSRAMTRMNYDFAAFTKQTDEEAMRRFIAALAGSPEVLDQWGINIKQGALDIELLNMGMRDTANGAGEQEKALARVKIIMDAMSDSQLNAVGAATRMSGSLGQQYTRMVAQMKQTAAVAGTAFMPAFQTVVGLLKDFFTLLRDNTDWGEVFTAFKERFSFLVDAANDLKLAFETQDWEEVFATLEHHFFIVADRMAEMFVEAMLRATIRLAPIIGKSLLHFPVSIPKALLMGFDSATARSGGLPGAPAGEGILHRMDAGIASFGGLGALITTDKAWDEAAAGEFGAAADRGATILVAGGRVLPDPPTTGGASARTIALRNKANRRKLGTNESWGRIMGGRGGGPDAGGAARDMAGAKGVLKEAAAAANEETRKQILKDWNEAQKKLWKTIVLNEMEQAMSEGRGYDLQAAREELRLTNLKTRAIEAQTEAVWRNAWEEMQAIGKRRKAKKDDIKLAEERASALKKENERVHGLYASEIESALSEERVFNVHRVVNAENLRKSTMLAAGQMRRTGGIDRALWNNMVSMNNRFKPQAAMWDLNKVGATTSGRAAAMGVGAGAGLLSENKKHTKLLRKIERKAGIKVAQ